MYKTNKPSDPYQISLHTLKNIQQDQLVTDLLARIAKPQINVLYYQRNQKIMKRAYILPVFARLMINRISSIDLEQDFGFVAGKLFLTIRYDGVPKQYVQPLLNNIVITINDCESMKLNLEEEIRQSYINDVECTVTFIKTMKFQALLDAQVFFAPFQRIVLSISLDILPYFHEERDQEGKLKNIIGFRFNNMISHNLNHMFTVSSRKSGLKYGEYSLARSTQFLKVQISDCQGNQITRSKAYQIDIIQRGQDDRTASHQPIYKFKQASSISFSCMLYRHPSVSIITIFVPMWILGFIGLMVFAQNQSFNDKVINTATIYISFATYFQVIRSVLPKSPHISLMQIFVYGIIGICILALVQALIIKDDPAYSQIYQFQRPLFVVSFTIQLSTFCFVVIGFLVHRAIMLPSYNKYKPEQNAHISTKIYFRDWHNDQIRQDFQHFKYSMYYADNDRKVVFKAQNKVKIN